MINTRNTLISNILKPINDLDEISGPATSKEYVEILKSVKSVIEERISAAEKISQEEDEEDEEDSYF